MNWYRSSSIMAWKIGDRVQTDAGNGEIIALVHGQTPDAYFVVQWDGTSSRGPYRAHELRPVGSLRVVRDDGAQVEPDVIPF